MQVGRSDNERSWAYRRSLNNTGIDISECRCSSGKLSAVSVVSKKIKYPVVSTARYCELRQFVRQRSVTDRIERLKGSYT